MNKIITTFMTACILLIAGCAQTTWLYRVPIQQGNVITAENAQQIRVGMTKEQVCDILGPPVLAATFNNNHWSYIYTFKSGRGKIIERNLMLYFKNNRIFTLERHNI